MIISWPNRWRYLGAAAMTLLTGRHWYLATSCLHDYPDYCAGERGHTGAKTPQKCKFCPGRCQHPRHR